MFSFEEITGVIDSSKPVPDVMPKVKRGVKYAFMILVIEIDGLEIHEKYVCKYDDAQNVGLTLEAIQRSHSVLSGEGVIVDSIYGKRIKWGNALVWFVAKPMRYSDAKTISKLNILPFLKIKEYDDDL